MPTDWSNLSKTQINILLLQLLWNLKKYPVQEEADSVFDCIKYRINDDVTIEPEYKSCFAKHFDDSGRLSFVPYYTYNSFNINGKSVSSIRILPRMLYAKCQKRCK